MDYFTITLAFFAFLATTLLFKFSTKNGKNKFPPPPGPKPLPIIGNFHMLGDKPHVAVTELAKLYGPIMSIRLGTVTTIVISSPEVAKEMYLKHDLAFSSRKHPDASNMTDHNKVSMVWLPVGPQWRNLRKIVAVQLFTNQRLDASQAIRQEKINDLVEHARSCCKNGLPVDIGKAGFTTSLNLLSNTFFSIDLGSHDSSYSQEFKGLVWNLLEEAGVPNISDYFPIVKFLDLQGVRKRSKDHFGRMLGVFEKIIDKRLKDEMVGNGKNDVLDTLLKLVKENELTINEIKHMFLDLFIAGTDTSSSTLDWAITELLRNPEKMAKAQEELDQVIGKNNGQIQESDISRLPYLQAVVKEVFRLHPVAPFLIPHRSEKDVDLCGYLVPKNAQIWVNVWAIGRDPKVWPNALSFLPERFLESETDMKGREFELIPFGAGRRICPGMKLGSRMVHLLLATLLHSFNWKCANGISPEDIDVQEKFGMTLQKVHSLKAIPLMR